MKMILTMALHRLPLLAVWAVAGGLAALRYGRHPLVSGLVMAASALMIAESLFTMVLYSLVLPAWTGGTLIYQVVSFGATFVSACAFGLLVAAAFTGRGRSDEASV